MISLPADDPSSTSLTEQLPLAQRSAGEQASTLADGFAGSAATVSLIMPTTSWTGMFEPCGRPALALCEAICSEWPGAAQLVIAFDGVAPAIPAWLDRPCVKVVQTGQRSGPAVARNQGAAASRGELLFFVDGDVKLAGDALDRVLHAFAEDPELIALFGSYDDEPADPGAVSQFRNLLHHHTHTTHPGKAGTFWSGCGAIRTAAFLDVGGFDERFSVPCVEDIELGMRIAANGGRILLDPTLQCKHLKRWTLSSMVITDIFSRAKPWTQLLLASGDLPASLNIDWQGRVSGICSLTLVAALLAAIFWPQALVVAAGCLAGLIFLNGSFYRLCLAKRGIAFAGVSLALHVLYFCYASLTFGVVSLQTKLFGVESPVPQLMEADSASLGG